MYTVYLRCDINFTHSTEKSPFTTYVNVDDIKSVEIMTDNENRIIRFSLYTAMNRNLYWIVSTPILRTNDEWMSKFLSVIHKAKIESERSEKQIILDSSTMR